MRFSRLRYWVAVLVAFVMGFPLSEKALAGGFDIVTSSFDFGRAIADLTGKS